MKAVFESMGFSVIHDTTLYDYPNYTGSYTRSLAGIQAMLEQYPTISVVLDVHRDALIASDGTVYKAVTQVNGGEHGPGHAGGGHQRRRSDPSGLAGQSEPGRPHPAGHDRHRAHPGPAHQPARPAL